MPVAPAKSKLPRPLGGSPPAEEHLAKAPLERVIAQVKFPVILKIEDKSAVSNFQELIRRHYPVLREAQNQAVQIQIGPTGPMAATNLYRIWQFSDAADEWKVSLARDALTIETTSYRSRADLLERWGAALDAFVETFRPGIVERIGMRYVDRMIGAQFRMFESLIDPRLIGSAVAELKPHLKFSLTEAQFEVDEGELVMRWGVMPPSMSPDPANILPVAETSFVLDIDVSSAQRREFNAQALTFAFRGLAERAYSVFRFAVTEDFLKAYGRQS